MTTENTLDIKSILKTETKQIRKAAKMLYKAFCQCETISNMQNKVKDYDYKVIYKNNNNNDDFLTDSENLTNLLRQAYLLAEKIKKLEITIITN